VPSRTRHPRQGPDGEHGLLFAGAYVALQVGRNLAAALHLRRGVPLLDVLDRLIVWSAASGALWLAASRSPRA
jgi:hypothetical protein